MDLLVESQNLADAAWGLASGVDKVSASLPGNGISSLPYPLSLAALAG